MAIKTVGLETGRQTFAAMASRANAGEPVLLTRHGKPYAAIVPPQLLLKSRSKSSFLALQGSGKGLWGKTPASAVAVMRDEWA